MQSKNFSDSRIIAILKEHKSGRSVSELCRDYGMSSSAFYRWRSKYGGMDASMMSRLKELESENNQLKKLVAESQLKELILKEALGKK